MPSRYRVTNNITEIIALSETESAIKSALYGVGISIAVIRSKASNNQTLYEVPENADTPYSPDAFPNANGGYDKTSAWDGYMSSSLVGMPVMSYLKFIGGTYVDLRGNTITIPDITFETVCITATMNKENEKTKIAGRDTGTVKESIGIGDWNVEIRAIITADAPVNFNVQKKNQDGVYPRDNMSEIWKVLRAPIALQVDCWFLNQFDINYLVVDQGVTIEQSEGEYSTQRLVIPCLSDNPLIIRTSA